MLLFVKMDGIEYLKTDFFKGLNLSSISGKNSFCFASRIVFTVHF